VCRKTVFRPQTLIVLDGLHHARLVRIHIDLASRDGGLSMRNTVQISQSMQKEMQCNFLTQQVAESVIESEFSEFS
jgi:hypothetical protein